MQVFIQQKVKSDFPVGSKQLVDLISRGGFTVILYQVVPIKEHSVKVGKLEEK
jgi:hypothetical protein